MTPLTTVIVTAAPVLFYTFGWVSHARIAAANARRPRWPQRVCGRLYDGGGIAGAGVTVIEAQRVTAGGTGR